MHNRAYLVGETGKIRWEVLHYCTGTGLDIGCGSDKIHKNALGVDIQSQPWNGRPNAANIGCDGQRLPLFADRSMDYVYSSHFLEHCGDPKKTLAEWWRVLKVGGYLVLYLPHPDLYREAMKDDKNGANDQHTGDYYPETVKGWMEGAPGGWDLVRYETHNGAPDEYSFLQVYRKRGDRKKVEAWDAPRPEKSVCVVRYGGWGDHVMTAAIYPVLKSQGYRVTLVTNAAGHEMMKACPYVDEIRHDTAGLTDPELAEYWAHLATRFDRFINMMDSVENVTLPQPTQRTYHLSKTLRDALFNLNYMQTTFAQAELEMPDPPGARWYATEDEKKWAKKERAKIAGGEGRVVVLALGGSSIHKASPWWGKVISYLTEDPYTVVVSIGGQKESLMYRDMPEDPRHVRKAGEWSLRQSAAFLHEADHVVGPETGALNTVGEMEKPSKTVLLSHSSEEQLCGYWKNYTALRQPEGEGCDLQPCHRLHWAPYSYCQMDEATSAAKCAAAITPEAIADAVVSWYNGAKQEKAA